MNLILPRGNALIKCYSIFLVGRFYFDIPADLKCMENLLPYQNSLQSQSQILEAYIRPLS